MIDLNQLLREQKYRDKPPSQERRAFERHSLDSARGEFYYRGVKLSCRLINVSMGGCCVSTEQRFMGGALAHVEVVLPVCGMVLRLVGTTVWSNEDNRVGVRFLHPSTKSKNQLAGLISCLIDQVAAEAVQEVAADQIAAEAASTAAILAQEGDLTTAEAIAVADKAVHGDQKRVRSYVPGEWPAVLRSVAKKLQVSGSLADFSLNGCIFRASKPFTGVRKAEVEIEFEIRGLHFRLAGVAVAIYNAQQAGVRFEELVPRKREELAQLLDELGGSGGQQIASKRNFAEDQPEGIGGGKKEDEIDDWKITFRER